MHIKPLFWIEAYDATDHWEEKYQATKIPNKYVPENFRVNVIFELYPDLFKITGYVTLKDVCDYVVMAFVGLKNEIFIGVKRQNN